MHTRGRQLSALLSAAAALLVATAMAGTAPAAVVSLTRNVAPSPNFPVICAADGKASAICRASELAAIQHARALEHVRPLVLPRNFWSLSGAEQVFVLTDVERYDRGVRTLVGLATTLDPVALAGAAHDRDPVLSGWVLADGTQVYSWGSVWAADTDALTADYAWMYNDGWGGSVASTPNRDCSSPTAAGCWGHRRVLLDPHANMPLLIAGAARTAASYPWGFNSDAEILVGALPHPQRYAYSWGMAYGAGAR